MVVVVVVVVMRLRHWWWWWVFGSGSGSAVLRLIFEENFLVRSMDSLLPQYPTFLRPASQSYLLCQIPACIGLIDAGAS
jgi:hypothetical protein